MILAKEVATALIKSGLWADANDHTVLMLCYLAEAEGHHPAVVYRDYHIMSGKPAKKAEAILRDFSAAGGRVEWHTLDDKCADATFHHPNGTVRIEWTLERARQAGLKSPMWQRYPRQMLRSRCISEGVRSVCPAATSGLYEVDEVRDIVADETPQQQAIATLHACPPEQEGQSQVGAVSPPAKRANWGGRYPNKTALHKGLTQLERELRGCGDADMVYALTQTEDWREFVKTAEEHAPHYLHGGEPAPPEFVGLIEQANDMIAQFTMEDA